MSKHGLQPVKDGFDVAAWHGQWLLLKCYYREPFGHLEAEAGVKSQPGAGFLLRPRPRRGAARDPLLAALRKASIFLAPHCPGTDSGDVPWRGFYLAALRAPKIFALP